MLTCASTRSRVSGTHAERGVHVGCAQALPDPATREVDGAPDHAGEDTVAWIGHGRERLPSIGGRVVDLDLAEESGDLPAEHVEALADDTGGDARAASRQLGTRRPGIGRRIVRLVRR